MSAETPKMCAAFELRTNAALVVTHPESVFPDGLQRDFRRARLVSG
jgi:hypothetical protein